MPRTTKQNEARSDKQAQDIQELKTNFALMQQDMKYQSKTIASLDTKIDAMSVTIQNLKYVPIDLYVELKNKVADLEKYIDDNKTGINFISKITSNILTTVASVAAIALLGIAAYSVIWGRQ